MMPARFPHPIHALAFAALAPLALAAEPAAEAARGDIAKAGARAYTPPADPAVRERLAAWGDLKFGLMMHWGPYCQWGTVESWSICPEPWITRDGPLADDFFGYKKAYEALPRTFNPVRFDPAKWARAARDAGMGYVVYTTKHHDGFCMYDSALTDYRVTHPSVPFAKHPKADTTRAVFESFRAEGFMIGAYFSKPDWSRPEYWWPYYPPLHRHTNYDPAKHPARWNAFKDFTRGQIDELMSRYGRVDILWLDGGWVRPKSSVDPAVDWQRDIPHEQDIGMARIAAAARAKQPGLIIVDRTVGGEFENYATPEQEVPAAPLGHPWETCMTMATSWSFVPGDRYKPSRELIHTLLRVVSRGGNLLLNIGPGPEGDYAPEAYDRLRDIADWMRTHREGVFATRPVAPYGDTRLVHTQNRTGDTRYAFLLPGPGAAAPDTLTLPGVRLTARGTASLLGDTAALPWENTADGLRLRLDAATRARMANDPAPGFKLTAPER